jgi:hypothetical protein
MPAVHLIRRKYNPHLSDYVVVVGERRLRGLVRLAAATSGRRWKLSVSPTAELEAVNT